MTELFTDISPVIKNIAKEIWGLASLAHDPVKASEILEHATNYYSYLCTEEEIAFIRFYINMKLEEMKNASSSSTER